MWSGSTGCSGPWRRCGTSGGGGRWSGSWRWYWTRLGGHGLQARRRTPIPRSRSGAARREPTTGNDHAKSLEVVVLGEESRYFWDGPPSRSFPRPPTFKPHDRVVNAYPTTYS